MYLLDRDSDGQLRLTSFDRGDIPRYAILSHTWGTDEVSFKDVRKSRYREKTGYKKIEFCLDQARADGLRYCWVDTCCIDKANSTELSEAINSMFRWYSGADRCYVYLSDVSTGGFQSSRWFTRGWTLQELLAPATVEFFSRDGQKLGDKKSLMQGIHERTQIPVSALQGTPLADFDIEERMLWIEQRNTKLEEDMAYSLLGIFGISMPLIYGEGRERAEFRLRQHITESLASESQILDKPRRRGTEAQGGHTGSGSSIARSYTGSSSIVSDQSRPTEAEKTGIQTTAGRKTMPEEDHVLTLVGIYNLGIRYANHEKLPEAEQMFDRALVGQVKALGWDHASTLDTVDWLGIVYERQGRLAEAESMYCRALTGREKVLGSEDTATTRLVYNMGILFANQRRFTDAEAMFSRALAVREKVLGQVHVWTLDVVDWLGIIYKDQGRVAEAEVMYCRALTGREEVLGQDHPSTLDIVYRLGILYADQGRLTEAQTMLDRALAGRERALRPDHLPQRRAANSPSPRHAESSLQDLAETRTTYTDMSEPSIVSLADGRQISTTQRTGLVAAFKRLIVKK